MLGFCINVRKVPRTDMTLRPPFSWVPEIGSVSSRLPLSIEAFEIARQCR